MFSETVTGFTNADVSLAGSTANVSSATTTVTGSGTTYTVEVSGITLSGTVMASIPAGGAVDASGNANTGSTSTDNTVTYFAQSCGSAGFATKVDFGTGTHPYSVTTGDFNKDGSLDLATANLDSNNVSVLLNSCVPDTTPPTVTINQATGQADPTGTSPINFTVIFSEAVTGFDSTDVTLSGTAGATTATVTGSGTAYNVAVSGMTQNGTVIANIAAGRATDAAGNPNTASTSTDNTVTFTAFAASINATAGTPQSAPVNTAFAINLQATVRDGANNPLSGVTVTFNAPASGASGTFANGTKTTTATTNTNGVTTASIFTANGTAGSHNVTASTGSLSTTFALTNNAQTTLSITDASVTEGDSGTTNAVFTVTLSGANNQTVTVAYQTADGTATIAGGDYQAASGTLTFAPGETTKNITVLVNGDTKFEADETFSVNLSNAVNTTIARASGTGTIRNDDAQGGTVKFAASAYNVGENGGQVIVSVIRTGDLSAAIKIDYASSDITAKDHNKYNTALGTLSFAAGEGSKTIAVMINEESYLEGQQTFSLTLGNATGGAVLGSPSTTIVTITEDDVSQPSGNIIDDAATFVRQQYHDFLDREPDAGGFAYWTGEITKCGADQSCINRRRVDVAAAFFIEKEYQDTGFAAYRLYKAMFGRAPTYLEYTKARSQIVAGNTISATKAELANELVASPEVTAMYANASNAEYVDATYAHTQTTPVSKERESIVNALDSGTQTRAEALVRIADTQAFVDAEYNAAFVTMQYFGYLRRDAEAEGFKFWLDVLNSRDANNYRGMVCAFINSAEYQQRFSPLVTHTDKDCGR